MAYKNKSFNFGTKKLTSVLLPLSGIAIIVILIGAMWWWEVDGRQRTLYVSIPVLKTDVKRGDLIKSDMFDTVKREKESLISNYVTDPNKIVGKEAKQYIPKNMPLDPQFFESPELITDKDRKNWKLPNEWIYAMPNSLRRKDHIVLYEVSSEIVKSSQNDVKKIQIDAQSTTSPDGRTQNANIQVYQKIDDVKNKISNMNDPLFKSVVSYVKDTANREVVSTSSVDRLDANATIKDVEILATKEEIDILAMKVANGSKFIIGYSDMEGDQ